MDSKIPYHIIRYEDILGKPKDTMMGLFQFVLHQNNIKDTNIEKLIDLTVAEEAP
jgi:hypothetical protein